MGAVLTRDPKPSGTAWGGSVPAMSWRWSKARRGLHFPPSRRSPRKEIVSFVRVHISRLPVAEATLYMFAGWKDLGMENEAREWTEERSPAGIFPWSFAADWLALLYAALPGLVIKSEISIFIILNQPQLLLGGRFSC